MSAYVLSDLEEIITDCWSILTDIKSLDEAVLETDINKQKISNILLGLKELYQIKFDKLSIMIKNTIVDSDFEQYMLNCWNIVDDLLLLHEFLNKIDMNKDKISNTLMGIEYIYELKFNKFWDYYIALLKEQKS